MKTALAIVAALAMIVGVTIMIVTAVVDIVIDFESGEYEEEDEW